MLSRQCTRYSLTAFVSHLTWNYLHTSSAPLASTSNTYHQRPESNPLKVCLLCKAESCCVYSDTFIQNILDVYISWQVLDFFHLSLDMYSDSNWVGIFIRRLQKSTKAKTKKNSNFKIHLKWALFPLDKDILNKIVNKASCWEYWGFLLKLNKLVTSNYLGGAL